jgi:hypothetical protein
VDEQLAKACRQRANLVGGEVYIKPVRSLLKQANNIEALGDRNTYAFKLS